MAKVVQMKSIERFGLKLVQHSPKPINPPNPHVRIMIPEDGERLYELLADHVKKNTIAMVWDKDDFLWYINQPSVLTVVHENDAGQVDGYILAWKMMLAGKEGEVQFGWLDNVHIYNLSIKEAADLCRYLCVTAYTQGWAGIQNQYIPYFDHRPFRKAGFLLFPRMGFMNFYYFKERIFPEPLPKSLYLDWR